VIVIHFRLKGWMPVKIVRCFVSAWFTVHLCTAPIDINNEYPYTKIIKVLQCEMLELCLWDLKEI
jgi:hypothetical protein